MEPVASARAGRAESGEVCDGSLGPDEGAEGRCVGSDDDILGKSPLEPQTGNAEAGVLVRPFEVASIERGLGHAPGHAALGGIAHLAAHDERVGLIQQAPGRRTHHQRGHQVLEHRAGP